MNCYFEYDDNDLQNHPNTGPCAKPDDNSVVQCCDVGDYCLSNGICQLGPGQTTGDGVSGYYIAGCTDNTFRDPACQTNCTAYPNSDVVYDWTAGAWRCCGNDSNGERNCSTPQGAPMMAPPPQALKYVASIIGTGSMLPLETGPAIKTSSSHPSSTATTEQAASAATGLSPGAAAGIAIAALLGLLILIAIPVAIIWRRKRRSTMHQVSNQQISSPIYSPTVVAARNGGASRFGSASIPNDYYAQDRSELKAPSKPAARQGRHELEHSNFTAWKPFPSELGTDNRI